MNNTTTSLLTQYYLLITGILILFLARPMRLKLLLLGCRAMFILVLSILCFYANSIPVVKFITDWLPLVTIFIFYNELSILTKLIYSSPLDQKIQNMEQSIFKFQPSLRMSEFFDSKHLSNFFHFSYLCYYPLIFALPVQFYFARQMENFYQIIFAEQLVMYVCFLIYIIIPVAGPRYLFNKIENPKLNNRLFRFTHKLLEGGSSCGTAFPSSHVALTSIIFFYSLYLTGLEALVILPVWIGIVFGVVYCRFHYALDSVFGLVLAIFLFLVSVIVYNPMII